MRFTSFKELIIMNLRIVLYSVLYLQIGTFSIILAQNANLLFTNTTVEAGVSFKHNADRLVDIENAFGTGAAWFDFDRDGDLDLYLTQRNGANKLFRNNGGAAFSDIAEALGVRAAGYDCAGVAVADFNNDGWLDMYVTTAREDILYKNVNGEKFVNIYRSAGFDPQWMGRGTSASWGDYDNDGFLDLYVAQHIDTRSPHFENGDRLFHNSGDETFRDVSHLLGEDNLSGFGFIAGWSDFDNDNDLDIYLINDCPFSPKPHRLFRNDGGSDPLGWQFTEVSNLIGGDVCQNGMGIAIGDYNRDGWQDYFFTNIGRAMLCENREGLFEDVTARANVDYAKVPLTDKTAITWGCNFVDYDLDGWLDLFVAAGPLRHTDLNNTQPNLLFRNDKNGETFTDVSATSGVDNPLPGRTSIFGDYDGDGDPDLYLVNYGNDSFLFRNENASGNHFLIVELQGTRSNRDGIGAKLRLTMPDGAAQYQETHSGSSLGGGDDLAAYFGLGKDLAAKSLQIRWPSGILQTLNDIDANQRLKVVEPSVPDGLPQDVVLLESYPNPFNPVTTIRWGLPKAGMLSLKVYNTIGQAVKTLAAGTYDSGYYAVTWDGTDENRLKLASGMYIVQLTAGALVESRKIILAK